MSNAISDLPIRLAIDVVLRDVGYTNALPDWFVTRNVDYSARQTAIANKIAGYLDGGSTPQKPFAVLLPRKLPGSQATTWLQPSINDVMILQACVTSLAPRIDATFDRQRVYSYRYNTDKKSTALTEDQCDAWNSFNNAVKQHRGSVLYLDLEQSCATIKRERFWSFLEQFSSSMIEVKTLKALINGFAPSEIGIPLINNALFFLTNAYFSEADKIISTHTKDYVRWNDDYFIFGSSQADLESLYKSVNKDLSNAGFKPNEIKTNIAQSQEYCDAFSKAAAGGAVNTDRYTPVPVGQAAIDPAVIVTSIKSTVQHPDRYLNDGIGRAQLASLQKLRDSDSEESRQQFASDLAHNSDILEASSRLLTTYISSAEQTWRSVWLLYLMRDVDPSTISDTATRAKVKQALSKARNSAAAPVVKLWAKAHTVTLSQGQIESLSDMSYEAAGQRCYGG